MIGNLIYRCPACGRFDWLDQALCRHCRVRISRPDAGTLCVGGNCRPLSWWYRQARNGALAAAGDRIAGRVRLSVERRRGEYQGEDGRESPFYRRCPVDRGWFEIHREGVAFKGRRLHWRLDWDWLTALTIESNTLIIAERGAVVWFADFVDAPGKQFEDLLRQALDARYAPRQIVEYCPRLRTAPYRMRTGRSDPLPARLATSAETGDSRRDHLLTAVRFAARVLIRSVLRVRVFGRHHLPRQGAVVLVANHSSFLDAIILQAFTPRTVRFMTKSTQFENPLLKRVLTRLRAFPVRRYTTDVATVRNALRVVARGRVLGLFPEGERCWDGSMLPLKTGTVRLILAMDVPVVAVGLSGGYDLMPRWTHRIYRTPITVRFSPPFHLPAIPFSRQDNRDVAAAARRLSERIQAMTTNKDCSSKFKAESS